MDRRGYIVCVDDEPAVIEALRQQLEETFSETHDVATASSAEEGLEIIRNIQESGELVELVITDHLMPGMKGDEFIIEVNKHFPDTMKILLTGQAGLDATINALNHGGLNRYIEKPWNKDSLRRDIETLVGLFRENLHNQYLLNNLDKRISEFSS